MKSLNKIIHITLIGLAFLFGDVVGKTVFSPIDNFKNLKHNLLNKNRIYPFSSYSYYEDKKSFFKLHGNLTEIVMIGDSLIDGAEWHEMFPNKSIANRGINGDTTEGVLKRLNNIYLAKPQKAFILIGANDLIRGKSIDNIFEQYKLILANLIENKITPYVFSIIHVGTNKNKINPKIKEFNKKLESYLLKNKIVFINLNTHLSINGSLNSKYSQDGLHLNGYGYTVVMDAMSEHI